MTNLVPAMPTDSLYKFIALFGLVLAAFGFYFPNERQMQIMAEVRNSNKARQLAQIRLDRKKVQNDKLLEEWTAKSSALKEKQKLLEQARGASEQATAALVAKAQALKEQLARLDTKTPLSIAKNAAHEATTLKRQATILKSDADTRLQKESQYSEEVKRLVEELKPVEARYEEFSDEVAAETVTVKNDKAAYDEQLVMMQWWLIVMCVSIPIGVVMILVGFILWYVRIQVHQDAILREQAANKGVSRAPAAQATEQSGHN